MGKAVILFTNRRLVAAIGFLLTISSAPVLAECGPGKTPTYADVQSVSYGRTACFGRCPSYEVLFTYYNDCEYVGELYVAMPGTYESDCSPDVLRRAVAALNVHKFYTLNYDSHVVVTDVSHYFVSVKRCGVTTKLDWPAYNERKDIESLLSALDKITRRIPWQKKSDATVPTWIQ